MTEYETNDIDICVDCAMLIANGGGDSVDPSWCPPEHRANDHGYTPGDCQGDCAEAAENHAAAVDTNWPDPWVLAVGSAECEWCGTAAREQAERDGGYIDDCEPWFAWSACDGCGSTLGGNRIHAVAMLPLEEGAQR